MCYYIKSDKIMTGEQNGERKMYIISAVLEKERSKVALFDKDYRLLSQKEAVSANPSGLCLDMMSENGIRPTDVKYIGIAVDQSVATAAAADEMEQSIGIPCLAASLMGARALGEAYTANDIPFLCMLKIDDTVECGIVVDKKIYSGTNQMGGRVAHIIINLGGYECTCGRQGCFEAYASNAGLKRIAAESGVADVESLTHATLFAMHTPAAEQAKKLYVEYLASGITDIINLFQPHELVLEGAFAEAGDALLAPMMDIILREQYTHSVPNKCTIRFPHNGTDTALLGAALLGRHNP